MKMIDFLKKNYEIFVVNFIILGFITFTLLTQFGVHIKVDQDVELLPVEIGYTQSTRRINSKPVLVTERHVRLKYKNNTQNSFWRPASVAFGKVSAGDIETMIKDGTSIKRNVFFNSRSNKVIGITKNSKSILSLYYYNSKMFRYGMWILILCDIFVGFVMKSQKEKTTNNSPL